MNKKALILALVMCLTVTATACGKEKENSMAETGESSKTTDSTEESSEGNSGGSYGGGSQGIENPVSGIGEEGSKYYPNDIEIFGAENIKDLNFPLKHVRIDGEKIDRTDKPLAKFLSYTELTVDENAVFYNSPDDDDGILWYGYGYWLESRWHENLYRVF